MLSASCQRGAGGYSSEVVRSHDCQAPGSSGSQSPIGSHTSSTGGPSLLQRSVSAFESRMPLQVIGEQSGGAAVVVPLAIGIGLLSCQVESAVALVLDGNGRS